MSGDATRAWRLAGALCGLVVALDQGAKAAVEAHLAYGEQVDLLGPLSITLARNTGIAFGLARDGGNALIAITAISVVLVCVFFARNPTRPWMWAAMGLILGGAFGNFADRARVGAVTDYVDFLSWPPFNLADAAITVGVLLLAWSMIREPTPAPTPQSAAPSKAHREEGERPR